MGLKVLSLFDGCGCARQSLKNIKVKVDKYYASEIDKYCIKISSKNHPDIIQVGDINRVKGKNFKSIDLIIGGFQCQSFSLGGSQGGFKDPRGQLFFEYVRLLNEIKPTYFLAENVPMKEEYQDRISDRLGVEPVLINSNLVTAQNRKRLYWSNFNIVPPKDRGITFGQVKLKNLPVSEGKYYNKKNMDLIKRLESQSNRKFKIFEDGDKFNTIVATTYKGLGTFRLWGIKDKFGLRYIHPVECERLQGMPDNYTQGVSSSQRYKMIGNAFTIPVIEHILKEIV